MADFYEDQPWLGGGSVPPAQRQTQTNSPANQNWWNQMSPQMQAALVGAGTSIAGGYIQGREERGAQRENNEAAMQRLELQLQMEREQREREMLQRQKELGLQTANQVPQRQDWRQHQALLAAMLPGARNYSVQTPAGLEGYMPQLSGGMRIPEGGFDQSTLAFFSPQARAGAEADLDRAGALASGGNYSTPDYSRAGYGDAAGTLQQDNQAYADKIRQQALAGAGQTGSLSPLQQQRQTTTNVGANARQPQQQGPSTQSRIAQAALQAGLGYLGSRYGGSGGQSQGNPWVSAGLGAMGAFF